MAASTETRSDIISSFNHGTITSDFAPEPSCVETFTTDTKSKLLFFGHGGPPYVDYRGIPTGEKNAALLSGAAWKTFYYSPVMQCPRSWTGAATFTSTWYGFDSKTVMPLGPETTAVLCCPSRYSRGQWAHQCTSRFTASQVLAFIDPTQPSILRYTTATSASFVRGDGVPIWWQSSDKATAGATPTSTTGPELPSPSTTDAQFSSTDSQSKRLSTGATIGLAVGISIAVLLGLIIAWLMFRRRKTKQANVVHNSKTSPAQQPADPPLHELGAQTEQKYEIGAQSERIYELPAT